MPRTPKVVEDRREQILDAAMHAFAQKGFSRATNKDIAREAGITAGLIYHYFESKEALLRAILRRALSHPFAPFFASYRPGTPSRRVLHYMVRALLSLVEGESFIQLIRVMLPEIMLNSQLIPISGNIFKQATGFLALNLQPLLDRAGVQQDATLLAQLVISSIIGFVLRRQIIQDPLVLQYSQSEIADIIVDTLLQGILPR